MDDNKLETLKNVIKPFIRPGDLRSETDLLVVEERIKQSKFIEDLTKEYNSRQFIDALCRSFNIEVLAPYERLTTFGELNYKFYIVLYGSLKVLVPEFKSSKDMTQKEMKDSLIRRLSLPTSSFLNFKVTKDRSLVSQIKEILGQKPLVFRVGPKFDMDYMKKLGTISVMKEKSKLLPGDSYGEQFLSSEKPRDSTVETREVTICASLDKETYQKIIANEEERRTIERVNFLRKLPIFNSIPKKNLLKLVQYFSVHTFIKNQLVYRDKMPADFVYFIESGEFQLSKPHDESVKKVIEAPLGFASSQKSLIRIENAREIKYTQSLQVAIRSKLEMLGYEEYLSKNPLRAHTCKCISPLGVLYAIKTNDFKQRVNDPDSIKFLQERFKFDVDHENHINTAGKIMNDINKSESKPILNSIARGENYLKILVESMHEKKSHRKMKSSSTINNTWYYPSFDKSFSEKQKKPPNNVQTQRIKKKPSEVSFLEIRERIRRVPPPNFMIGMRDLRKVYEKNFRIDNSNKRVLNLSSIY